MDGETAVAMVSPATSFYVAVAVAYNDPGAAGLMDQWNFTWQYGTNDNALQAGQGLGPESLYIGTAPMPGDCAATFLGPSAPPPLAAGAGHCRLRPHRAFAAPPTLYASPALPSPSAFPAFVVPADNGAVAAVAPSLSLAPAISRACPLLLRGKTRQRPGRDGLATLDANTDGMTGRGRLRRIAAAGDAAASALQSPASARQTQTSGGPKMSLTSRAFLVALLAFASAPRLRAAAPGDAPTREAGRRHGRSGCPARYLPHRRCAQQGFSPAGASRGRTPTRSSIP